MSEKVKTLIMVVCFCLMFTHIVAGQIFLPGTQPGAGRVLDGPGNCGCHKNYNTLVEPFYNWEGSMMSQAARDPLFYAALDITNNDVPNAGEFCIRCHSPRAFFGNRALPADGSAMTGDDFQGVFCDFCHAKVDPLSAEGNTLVEPDVTTYGSGMYVITNTTEKRGPYNDATAPHTWQASAFHRSGNFCGVCHDVSNPTNCPPGDPYNAQLCFPVERTYSEWNNSWYATQGEAGNCQSCHMPHVQDNKACKQGGTRTFLPVHHQNGGNTWLPDLIINLYPADVNALALTTGKNRAASLLQSAAVLEAFDRTDIGAGEVELKVTNLTGHKLPTGYPEGRRVWLNVVGYNKFDAVVFQSGQYDASTAVLTHDPQIKIYESEPGMLSGPDCTPTFHFVLNNCIHKDNRIPPVGFTNAAFAAVRAQPVNYTYADGQNWDYTPYYLSLDVTRIVANLYYQTASKEYVDFLHTAPGSGARGATLFNAWNTISKSPPVLMQTINLSIDDDHDGMGNAWEIFHGLNPAVPDESGDADTDGLTNLQEYQLGTYPTNSDTDGDSITDYDDYLNPTTDPLAQDIVCRAGIVDFGLFCWADTDGNGSPTGADSVNLNSFILSKTSEFPAVYPKNGNTMDLNGDGGVTGSDSIILSNWLLSKASDAEPPTSIVRIDPAVDPAVAVGDIQVINVKVLDGKGMAMAGVGTLFTISGNGELIGGRGNAEGLPNPEGGNYPAGSRWDITGTIADGGIATMYVKVTGSGPIIVNVSVSRNSVKQLGAAVSMPGSITINP